MTIYQNTIDNAHIIGIGAMMSQLHNSPAYNHWKKFSFSIYTTYYPVIIETPFLDTTNANDKEEFKAFVEEHKRAQEIVRALVNKEILERRRPVKKKTKESIEK